MFEFAPIVVKICLILLVYVRIKVLLNVNSGVEQPIIYAIHDETIIYTFFFSDCTESKNISTFTSAHTGIFLEVAKSVSYLYKYLCVCVQFMHRRIVKQMGSIFSSGARVVDMSGEKAKFVKDAIANGKVVIFSKTYCPYCNMAKEVTHLFLSQFKYMQSLR